MTSWGDFTHRVPEFAEQGRALLYQHGVGLAFLATTRVDGGPRLHPMCPLLTTEGLFAFIVPSPKRRDLQRDGRYAMHSFPRPDDEDAFYVTGSAAEVVDADVRSALAARFAAERAQFGLSPAGDDLLFEFSVERSLLTRTTGHGDPEPVHTVWAAP